MRQLSQAYVNTSLRRGPASQPECVCNTWQCAELQYGERTRRNAFKDPLERGRPVHQVLPNICYVFRVRARLHAFAQEIRCCRDLRLAPQGGTRQRPGQHCCRACGVRTPVEIGTVQGLKQIACMQASLHMFTNTKAVWHARRCLP